MKSIILIFSLILVSLTSNSQTFVFKTNPYTFNDETQKEVTIVGISARMINNIDCNLAADSLFYRAFYIEFKTIQGNSYGGLNTDTKKMAQDLSVSKNISLESAKAFIKSICRDLEYGTIQQKYDAAKLLAGGYGYTLKPIIEQ